MKMLSGLHYHWNVLRWLCQSPNEIALHERGVSKQTRDLLFERWWAAQPKRTGGTVGHCGLECELENKAQVVLRDLCVYGESRYDDFSDIRGSELMDRARELLAVAGPYEIRRGLNK